MTTPNKKELINTLEMMAELAMEERRNSQSYKDLVKDMDTDDLATQLRIVNDAMIDVVLNYGTYLQSKGILTSDLSYTFLSALPVLYENREKKIKERDGRLDCVPKTYDQLAKEFNSIIESK